MKEKEPGKVEKLLADAGEWARRRDFSPQRVYETRRLAAEALASVAEERSSSGRVRGLSRLQWATAAAVLVIAAFLVLELHQRAERKEAKIRSLAGQDARLLDFHIERQKAAVARDMARWRKQYLAAGRASFFDRRAEDIRTRIELCVAGIQEELESPQ